MSASLVGSEMCIRDSRWPAQKAEACPDVAAAAGAVPLQVPCSPRARKAVSYTHLTLPTICSV
eukprot:3913603-Alexandrium_andersonii.AAC.1